MEKEESSNPLRHASLEQDKQMIPKKIKKKKSFLNQDQHISSYREDKTKKIKDKKNSSPCSSVSSALRSSEPDWKEKSTGKQKSSIFSLLLSSLMLYVSGGRWGLRPLPLENSFSYGVKKKQDIEANSIVGITIKYCDDLVEKPSFVRVHVVDACTGGYKSIPSKNSSKTKNPSGIPSGKRNEIPILPSMTFPCDFNDQDCPSSPVWNELLLFNEVSLDFLCTPSTLFLFELLSKKSTPRQGIEDELHPVAWGFVHLVNNKGNINSSLHPREDPKSLRLCLFHYQTCSSFIETQAKAMHMHPNRPAVFLQYQRFHRKLFPCTLHIDIGARYKDVSSPAAIPETSPSNNNNKQKKKKKGVKEETSSLLLQDCNYPTYLCRRSLTEQCLIPQRLVYKLPSGRQGCLALQFSHSGKYLAAACVDGMQFPIRIFDLDRGTIKKEYFGHHGIVYDINWCFDDSLLMTTSADGTAFVWSMDWQKNEEETPNSQQQDTAKQSVVVLSSSPPTFVYCGIFSSIYSTIAFTGSFDHSIRMWNTKNGNFLGFLPQNEEFSHKSQINSMTCDKNSEKLYSGDEDGCILVWKAIGEGTKPEDFLPIRFIRHADLRGLAITSLQMHPKKNHLLVHAKGGCLRQFELRSYLLVNKGYAGIKCEKDKIRSRFSPDGRYVLAGSEDGKALLFTSHNTQQIHGYPWQTGYTTSLFDVAWCSTAHLIAFCSYGHHSPILVYGAKRGDEDLLHNHIAKVFFFLSMCEYYRKPLVFKERKERINIY